MKKSTLIPWVRLSLIAALFFQSCEKKKDVVVTPVPDQTNVQELDNIAAATAAGWKFYNKSEGQTLTSKGFVNGTGFAAYSGTGFLYAGFESGEGLLSAWAVSPSVTLQNGDKISFYTRSYNDYSDPANVYADRLQLRLSLADKDSVGPGADGTGLFSVPLADINPAYSVTLPDAYPGAWTKYEATISALNKPVVGRFAFRYYVEDGGTTGSNSNGIALDKVQYTSVNHQ